MPAVHLTFPGAGGLIGNALVRRARVGGHDVRAVLRGPPNPGMVASQVPADLTGLCLCGRMLFRTSDIGGAVWGYAVLRCPACGMHVGPDFVFCHECGTALRPGHAPLNRPAYGPSPHMVYAPSYPMAVARPQPAQVRWGSRTRRGLVLTLAALIVLWIPGLTIVGAILLSIGSTLMFWDRHPFRPAHRSAMRLAYALLWMAAAVYAIVFLSFVSAAYGAWLDFRRIDALQPATAWFILDSTIPTVLIIVALVLQIRFLLPPPIRRQAWWAGIALVFLVLLATVLAYLDAAAGLGSDFVRMSSVLGVLNRISVARIVEAPGFAWLAYLYYRARGNVVPTAVPVDTSSFPA